MEKGRERMTVFDGGPRGLRRDLYPSSLRMWTVTIFHARRLKSQQGRDVASFFFPTQAPKTVSVRPLCAVKFLETEITDDFWSLREGTDRRGELKTKGRRFESRTGTFGETHFAEIQFLVRGHTCTPKESFFDRVRRVLISDRSQKGAGRE